MTVMRESGQKPADFAAEVSTDPDEALYEPAKRHTAAALPSDLPAVERKSAISVQNDRAIIFREPACAQPVADPGASDGVAIQMIAGPNGSRGAMEIHGGKLAASFRPGRYKVYYVARVEVADATKSKATAFSARVHDGPSGKYIAERAVEVSETAQGYRSYLVGTMEVGPYTRLWMGHAHDDAVKSVAFDRVVLVPVR
jgi:hypothetical protein